MSGRRASATAVLVVLACVLTVTLLVTWAASIGPGGVLRGAGPATHRVSPTQTPTPTAAGVQTTGGADRVHAAPPGDQQLLFRAVAIVVEVALLALALFLLYRMARWALDTWDARRRREPRPDEIDFEVLGSPGRIIQEMARDAAAQRSVLNEGTPRNAIVECWHRFEVQAAGAGFARESWETSAEYTLRMLDLASADSTAVTALAQLYREARFSDHPLGEDARTRAIAALDAVHAGLLGARPATPAAGPQ